MVLNDIAIGFKLFFRRWFHKRNIIIVSEHKVKHLHLSTATQCVLLFLFAGFSFGASYYAGQFAAKHGSDKTLAQMVEVKLPQKTSATLKQEAKEEEETFTLSVADLMSVSPDMDRKQLIARVVMLEQQVSELETAKQNIIERVRDKTSGQIDNLEKIIKQTGLSPKELRKKFNKQKKEAGSSEDNSHVGGPYIADKFNVTDPKELALYKRLDELAMLREIIRDLPLALPMKNGEIHSHYGRRIDPFNRRLAFHSGMDMTGPRNAKIYSTANGVVTKAKYSKSYGNVVDIDHGYDVTTRYAHLSKLLVSKGQTVQQGDVIGLQGSTGRSTGQHLHYEVRYRNKALNPKRFVDAGRNVSEK